MTIPYLPTGFTQVANTNLSTGLIIQDSKENQYVWVEVPKTAKVYPTAGLNITTFTDDEYKKIEEDLKIYTNDYRKTGWTDEYYSEKATGLTNEQYYELKQKMLKSIYQNGGFYVGKYESGIENTPKTSGSESVEPTEIPVIKPNVYPYNYVTCSQAQTLASSMESGGYNTSLMFGIQWDLILKYLENKGIAQTDLKTDSTSWGNYLNNNCNIMNENLKYALNESDWKSATETIKDANTKMLLSTGANESFGKQEIYDLAGNIFEWTLEYTSYSSKPCACRGGGYNITGSVCPAASHNQTGINQYGYNVGFRVVLY